MKLNAIKSAALAVALSMTAAAPAALAQGRGGHEGGRGHMGGRWHGGGGFFRGVELTEAQKTQLRQIHESHKTSSQSIHEELRAKRGELHALTSAATFDEAAVRAKLAEIAPIEARMLAEQHRLRQESLSVLTPEQKTKLDERREQFKKRFEGKRGAKQGAPAEL